jgi:hypothetical protein
MAVAERERGRCPLIEVSQTLRPPKLERFRFTLAALMPDGWGRIDDGRRERSCTSIVEQARPDRGPGTEDPGDADLSRPENRPNPLGTSPSIPGFHL